MVKNMYVIFLIIKPLFSIWNCFVNPLHWNSQYLICLIQIIQLFDFNILSYSLKKFAYKIIFIFNYLWLQWLDLIFFAWLNFVILQIPPYVTFWIHVTCPMCIIHNLSNLNFVELMNHNFDDQIIDNLIH